MGFYRTVADEYDLDVISTDQQRLEFCAAEGIRPAFTRTETNCARDLAYGLLVDKLEEGTSALFDSHFNSIQNRDRIRNAARLLGAKPVLLVIHNKRDNIKANMQERFEKETLPKIDLMICSPLERTRHTAKYIAEEIGYPEDMIEHHDLFIERNFGPLENTKGEDFFENNEYKDIDALEGSETIEDLDKRAKKALEYVKSIDKDNILVVGHGSFGRAIRRAVANLPHTHEYEVYTPIGNAEIVELI